MIKHDIVIVGGGPGGYVTAARASGKGRSVLLVEKAELGGVCLNSGCIPTKCLLGSAKLYARAKSGARFGVAGDGLKFDMAKAQEWKDSTIKILRGNIELLMKSKGVEVVRGEAEFLSPHEIRVDGKAREAESLVIATGSKYLPVPFPVSGNRMLTSTEALGLREVPARVAVIGAGAVGLEFASLFANLGAKVSVIELLPEIAPFMDTVVAAALRRAMPEVEFHLSCPVESVTGGTVTFIQDGKTIKVEADVVLIATGRRAVTTGMEKLGLDITKTGIKVDDRMRTSVPGVYAVGDVNGLSLLAHSASRMGEVAADAICGGRDRMRLDAIPWVLYGTTEVAGVGLTEQEAKAKGLNIKTARVPMRGNGRFLAEHGNEPGLCKVVVDAETGVVRGVHLMGADCSEMIFAAALMIEAELRAKDVREVVFPHPTVSEVLREAFAVLE